MAIIKVRPIKTGVILCLMLFLSSQFEIKGFTLPIDAKSSLAQMGNASTCCVHY